MTTLLPRATSGRDHDALLSVRDLHTSIFTNRGTTRAVDGVSFDVRRGRTLGLVGESGSGKTLTCLSILGLLPPGGRIVSGEVLYRDADLARLSPGELRRYRGREIAMIPQDPLTALNPVLTIETQVSAPLRVHGLERGRRRQRAIELLALVGLPAPQNLLKRYPHQLSGGMRQRVASAVALAAGPSLLLADEPTTSLDPTIQIQFLQMLRGLQESRGLGIVFVTHDFGVVRRICDDVAVLYAGRIVEHGPVERVLREPSHPYTRGLLASLPELRGPNERLAPIPGQPPRPGEVLPGCPFAPRCPSAMEHCVEAYPPTITVHPGHSAACWLHEARP